MGGTRRALRTGLKSQKAQHDRPRIHCRTLHDESPRGAEVIGKDSAIFAAALILEGVKAVALIATGVVIGINPAFSPILVVGLASYFAVHLVTSALWSSDK